MQDPAWYQPVARGLEVKIAEKLAYLRQLDKDARSTPPAE
jgi:putative ATPase